MAYDVNSEIAKLKYQIRLIGETIDHRKHPIQSLVIEFDWSEEDLDGVHDVFEKWDKKIRKGEEFRSGQFEKDFEKFGISYQLLKSVINAFWRNDQWNSVCEAYVDSQGESPSVEYMEIAKRKKT